MNAEELKVLQAPLKSQYKTAPEAAMITLRATGRASEGIAGKVDTGRALVEAGVHPATGGDGSLACSGDMLLEALVACAGVPLRAVATAIGDRGADGQSAPRETSTSAAPSASTGDPVGFSASGSTSRWPPTRAGSTRHPDPARRALLRRPPDPPTRRSSPSPVRRCGSTRCFRARRAITEDDADVGSDLVSIARRRSGSDRYRIGAAVGQGGMAVVYVAEDVKHGRKVAIKICGPSSRPR